MADLMEDDGEPSQGCSLEEPDYSCCDWFFAREIIENSSPSRVDGIDAAKESYLRKSYCTFLQDLGMRLKVPQLTIATAIVFCHRFFLRQSHAKNDRYVIATACMFLAGKVEETPKLLQNVICVAYEIRHRKEPEVVQRIKIKEVYEREKEIVLLGEHLVLSTLEFDLNVHHPYKPLVAAIKKMKVAQNSLAQVAWNFVNDGLRTSICLQFKAHHIAAGAIFLAAKFLKVKLPPNGRKPWWQEFDVTPRQLEDVSNQMLELYEQIREISASRLNDLNGSLNHDKRAVNALPPGTPQVAEKRSTVEVKSRTATEVNQQPGKGETKTSWADFDQMNLEKLKSAVEKKRKLKAETGGAKSKLELTDEEELLERELEDGHKDDHMDSIHAHIHNIGNYMGGGTKQASKSDFVDENLETDQPDSFSDNKQWPLRTKDHYHASQTKRTDKTDNHYHSQKSRDWEEREHKRLRNEQID